MGRSGRFDREVPDTLFRFRLIAALVLLTAFSMAHDVRPLRAADTVKPVSGKIGLELNRLEAVGEGCRLSFIFRNGLQGTIEAMALELVLFDSQDRVAGLVAIAAGRLPAGKMRVRQFDIASAACSGIQRVLVNDVTACEGGGLVPGKCLDAIAVSSRAGVALVN